MYLNAATTNSTAYTIDRLAEIFMRRPLSSSERDLARRIFGGDTPKRSTEILSFHSMIVQQDPATNTPENEDKANQIYRELQNAEILAFEKEQKLAQQAVAIWEAENPNLAAEQEAAIQSNRARGAELLAQLEKTYSEVGAQLKVATGDLEKALQEQATALQQIGGFYYAMAEQGLSPDQIGPELQQWLGAYDNATQRVQAITNTVQSQTIDTDLVQDNFQTLTSFETAPVDEIVEELKQNQQAIQDEISAADAKVIADLAIIEVPEYYPRDTSGIVDPDFSLFPEKDEQPIMDFTFSNIPVTFGQVYLATFGRSPDIEGFNYWKGIIGGDLDLKEYDDFVYSGRINGEKVNEQNVANIRAILKDTGFAGSTPMEQAITEQAAGGNTGLLLAAGLAALALLG